jgi:glycosyltransferase involved in cell wall biosynthesis
LQGPSDAMKILWITSHADTLNSIRPEAETLIGLARRGDSIYRQPMEAAGVRVIDFVPRGKFRRRESRYIRTHLIEGRHDILHLFNNRAIANGVRAARELPVKVITYRGQTGNVHRYDPTCWLTHLHPRIDRVICVAEAVRRDIATRRLDPASCVTIYKGHDPAWYTDPPTDLSAEFGIPEDAFVAGTVANYRPRKGIGTLIEAVACLPPEAPIHLLLVGGGMDDPVLTRTIAASPCRDRIHLAGYRTDACALIAACNCAVLPSTKREGLPKTVIEAMVYGVPPVVTDTGGSAELVVDEDSGLVVPPGNPAALARAMMRLCEDAALARSLGEKARRRIDEHFNIRQTIERTLALYEDVLDD